MIRARFYTVPKVADNTDTLKDIATIVGGYTVTYGRGGWVDDSGELVEEPQATVEVLAEDIAQVDRVRLALMATALGAGESAILETLETVQGRFLAMAKVTE